MLKKQSANRRTKLVVIVGPTTSGKSDLGIKLARKFNGEIISADSRQVYRGMNIGTGKVKKDRHKGHLRITKVPFVSSGIAHHLLDVANPKKFFTVSDFKDLGEKAIKEIMNKNKIPFIVGGTGFYIDVLLGRMLIAKVPPDKNLRLKLERSSKEKLFARLKKLDPERAETIDSKNKRRIIRALEIIITTGKKVPKLTVSIHHDRGRLTQPDDRKQYKTFFLGINLGKDILSKKIKTRLDIRLEQGMIKEVVNLHKQGISWKRLDDLGLEYRWISRWLKNHENNKHTLFSNSQEYENLLRNIIKYSKRQMTWFKRNKEIRWIKKQREAEILIRKFISPLP